MNHIKRFYKYLNTHLKFNKRLYHRFLRLKLGKEDKGYIGLGLPKAFVNLIDEIVEKNPDFKNRVNVIRYSVRKYYDELKKIEKV